MSRETPGATASVEPRAGRQTGQRKREKKRKVEAEEATRDAPGSAGRPLAEDAGGGHGRRGETHRNTLRPAVRPSLVTLSL